MDASHHFPCFPGKDLVMDSAWWRSLIFQTDIYFLTCLDQIKVIVQQKNVNAKYINRSQNWQSKLCMHPFFDRIVHASLAEVTLYVFWFLVPSNQHRALLPLYAVRATALLANLYLIIKAKEFLPRSSVQHYFGLIYPPIKLHNTTQLPLYRFSYVSFPRFLMLPSATSPLEASVPLEYKVFA
jgi:hypothetical protein